MENVKNSTQALWSEDEEARMDIIGQNGNSGDHYDVETALGNCKPAPELSMSAVIGTYSEEIDGDVLDAAIDAAMEKENKE